MRENGKAERRNIYQPYRIRTGFRYSDSQTFVQTHFQIGKYCNIYTEYFRELVAAHSEYRELVQVNEWLPDENGDWRFNKMAFAGEDRIPRNYHKHIFKAEIAAEKMRYAFKKLEALSDLELWQSPFARKFVDKRIPPLSKVLSNPESN